MIYKHRSKVAHLPRWQSLATHIVFVICATSGSWSLLAHEFQITPIAVENHSILMAHGVAAYFLALLFGAVIPTHIKAGWKSKRNRVSGGFMVIVMSLLLVSGLFLYYADETRELALWTHWIIGGVLLVLFPFHFIAGRRANYLALKRDKHQKSQPNLINLN